ncbi:MAG: hypothetical protein LUF35_06065 [Lachnospiraceae bacterium]|nr:hypothetical protein [Lachnospiraceae bacterium]
MAENKLKEMKFSNFLKAVNREEGAYVPTAINDSTGSIAWAGKKTIDVVQNPQEYVETMTGIYDQMWADVALVNGVVYSKKLEEAFLHVENKYGPDGVTLEHVQLSPMQKDEYDQLIADPNRFVSEVLLPRKYPEFFEDREFARNALKVYAEDNFHVLVILSSMLKQTLEDKYGIVSVVNMLERIQTPLDILFDYFRGFRGTLTDLRRQPANVKAALDAIWEVHCLPKENTPYTGSFPYSWQPPHIPCYLSPKQYDELYWVHEKPMIERYIANGGKHYFIMEGKWDKIWDRFRELPKDSLILHVDDDNIIQAKKEIGDWQIIAGGLKLADCRLKTFDQIKDDIKRVVDECAPGGGFIFTLDKIALAPGDINQTVIDAYNFVHEYSSK